MSKKINFGLLCAIFTAVFASCNSAEDGFNAPSGSTVVFSTTGITRDFPDTGTANSCVEGRIVTATFTVNVPIGVTSGTTTATSEPGNKIHGVIESQGGVNMYRFKDNVKTKLAESSLLDAVPSGTFPFVTNERGIYTFAVSANGCYDSTGAIVGGSTSINVDIGVAVASLSVTIQ